MTLAEKIIARRWVTDLSGDRVGVPSVRPGDEGFVRTDIRFSHEYVTPMAAIFWRDYVGADEKVVDPGSIFFFRDHLTFLELAMTDARKAEGLLDVALELKKKQEEFAAEQGILLYGELPRIGAQHGRCRAPRPSATPRCWSATPCRDRSSSAATATRRTAARWAAWRSASAPRPSSIRGSPRTCASRCRRRC